MAKPARRYDIYLPLTTNDGQPIAKNRFVAAEQQLVQRFGGLTAQRQEFPLKGIWQGQTGLYVDEVIIMTVLDFRPRGSAGFIAELKHSMLRDFDQLEILITESPLRVH